MIYAAVIFLVVSIAYASYWRGRRVECEKWTTFLRNNAEHLDQEGVLEASKFLRELM